MPRRTDLKRVLVIGSGPIVIGQACEFDYSGSQACKALRAEGLEVVLVNSNPATIMTDPELADRTYVEPLTPDFLEAIIERERPDAILPTVGGQTALNLAVDLANAGILEKYNVKLIGASIEAIKIAEDRQLFKDAMRGDRPRRAAERARPEPARSGRPRAHARLPARHPPVVHARRRRRRHRLQHRGVPRARRARARAEPGPRGAHRGIGDRLEGIRARGDARRRRQLRRHLLDREHRSDGRPHRRQHHGGADPHAQRQGISADARCRAAHHPQGRRRDRRVEHPVRRQPGERPDGRHRDEPARVALVGARVEGDRLSDREDRRQARARLSPRRDPERHHARHAGLVRADHRLRRRQDSALELREVPAGRPDAHDADEVGRRGDGDRPHLQGSVHEGRALARARPQRSAVRAVRARRGGRCGAAEAAGGADRPAPVGPVPRDRPRLERRADSRDHEDRSVVPAAVRGDPRAAPPGRRAGSRRRRPGRLPPAEAGRLRRRRAGAGDGHDRDRGARRRGARMVSSRSTSASTRAPRSSSRSRRTSTARTSRPARRTRTAATRS